MAMRMLLLGLLPLLAAGCEQAGYSHSASLPTTALRPVEPESSPSAQADLPVVATPAAGGEPDEPTPEKPVASAADKEPEVPYDDDGSKDPSKKSLPTKTITFD